MSIAFHQNQQIVHITNHAISYVMEVVDGKYLAHRYFGKAIREYRGAGAPIYFKRAYNTEHGISIPHTSFDDFPFEYPVRGSGDFRIPAFSVTQESGITHIYPIFKSWTHRKGKTKIDGLPHVFANEEEAETLEIVCEDKTAGLRIYLYYSIFGEKGIILRHQKIENIGAQTVQLQNVQSASLELPAEQYDFLSLYGSHTREGNCERFSIHHGIQRIESVRGSSSPQHHPFFALLTPTADETSGDVYAMHLIYSGNFLAQAEVDQFGSVRAQIGLHPDTFRWQLKPGERFETPEAVLNYSEYGLNGMSHNFHWLYQNHLIPQQFACKNRPVLLNSWESMYYDVSLEKIDHQSDLAKQLGIELFVLDDGWFRSGNSSYTSLGDWQCNEDKLPGGIEKVSELIHEKGMQFGLWFEPEAVTEDSNLYQIHPDWALQVPGYEPVKGRHEYLLDLSRQDVQDYLVSILDGYIGKGAIDYIKWDMNRPLTDVNSMALEYSQKDEVSHRYVLGLYKVLNRITSGHPNVLIEGCSSGGARFDPGILYYVAQNWTSDNTDAYERTQIQSGYSMLYPPIAMGAHVSITPNHQTGRTISLNTRYQIARLFNLGYELDLDQCTSQEQKEIAIQIVEHKNMRDWIQNGRFFRHKVPNDNYVMWSVVSKQADECLVIIFQKLHNLLRSHGQFRLLGLNPQFDYCDVDSGEIYGGDELMRLGLAVPMVKKDFHVFTFHFTKAADK